MRLIQLLSAGYDKVDLDRCRAAGHSWRPTAVPTPWPWPSTRSCSSSRCSGGCRFWTAICARAAGRRPRPPEWEPHELEGRTVGLVGMGRIGREVARRLRPFDVQLQYYDVMPAPSDVTDSLHVRYVSWSQLLETSDIVSLHLPLMESTRGLIGAAELAQMKPDAILINTARGGLIDEAALVAALQSGRLGGAGLDAFSAEPFPAGHPLAAFDQVVLTPHFARTNLRSWPKRVRFAYENIVAVERDERPESVVPELADVPLRTAR